MAQKKTKKTFWPDPRWRFLRRHECLLLSFCTVTYSGPEQPQQVALHGVARWTLLGFRPHITLCSPVCWARNQLPRGNRGLRDSSQHLVGGQKSVSGVLGSWLPRSPSLITQVGSAHFILSGTSTGDVALHPASLLLSSPSLSTRYCRKNQVFLHWPLL